MVNLLIELLGHKVRWYNRFMGRQKSIQMRIEVGIDCRVLLVLNINDAKSTYSL